MKEGRICNMLLNSSTGLLNQNRLAIRSSPTLNLVSYNVWLFCSKFGGVRFVQCRNPKKQNKLIMFHVFAYWCLNRWTNNGGGDAHVVLSFCPSIWYWEEARK